MVRIPLSNSNDWDISAFVDGSAQDDGTYYSYDENNPERYIRAATHTYSQYANQMQWVLTGSFYPADTSVGYIGLTTVKNWIEIGGILAY